MRPIEKWAHAQRLISAAHVKYECMLLWSDGCFEKSKGVELEQMGKVVARLIKYSNNQLKQI